MKDLILLYLARCPKDLGLTERVLKAELSVRMRDFPGDGDLSAALLELERAGLVSQTRNVITGDRIWIITEAGRTALAQA